MNDPIGKAILEYSKYKKPADIEVLSDLCEDDIIPIEVLFRSYEEMPDLEKKALSLSKGSVLDVGAGAGSHAIYLQDLGLKVTAIDISEGAVEFMNANGIQAKQANFFEFTSNDKFDTVLMLMNGIGIAGNLANLEKTLSHAKSLLKAGGSIICDSSDIKYLYEDEDGALWIDLNTDYYGNFRFQMKYKKELGPWFDWLYVDFDTLFQAAKNVGLRCSRVFDKDDHFLAQMTLEETN